MNSPAAEIASRTGLFGRATTRLVILVGALLFAGISALGGYVAHDEYRRLRGDLMRQTDSDAREIAVVVTNWLLVKDLANTEALLLGLAATLDLRDILITDLAGQVLVQVEHNAGENPRLVFRNKTLSPPPAGGLTATAAYEITAWRPVVADNKPFGWVRLRRDLSGATAQARDILASTALIGGAVLAITLVLLVLLLRRPLRVFDKAVRFALTLDQRHGAQAPVEPAVAELVELQQVLNDVSLRLHEQDRQLAEGERALTTLVGNLPGMVYRCRNDQNWTVEYASDGCLALTGYRPDELGADGIATFGDLIHPHDRDKVWKHVQAALAERCPFLLHYRIRSRNGTEKFVREQGSGVYAADGALLALEGYITDISAEARAREETQKLSSAVAQTDDAIVITNADGFIEYVNPAFERHTGYRRAEVIGRTPALLKSGQHDAAFYRQLWGTLRRGEVFRAVFVNKRKGGELFHEEKTITPLKDEQGRVTHFVSAGRDISERLRAEENANALRHFLDSLVENVPNMLFVKDAATLKFVQFNKAAEELLGYPRAEMLGKDDYDFFPKDEADFFTGQDRKTLTSGELVDIPEEPIHTRAKGVRLLHTKKIPIADAAGKPLYLLGISEDITERKQAERALRENEQFLERVFDNTRFCVAYLDRDFNFVRVNQAYAKACGRPPESFPGKNHFQLFPSAENEAIFRRVVETGEAFSVLAKPFEFPDHPEWGVTHWDWSLQPLKDDAGRVEALLFVLLDVTEAKRAESQLARLGRILDDSSNEIYVFNAESLRFVQANQGAQRNLGYTLDELKALTPVDIKPEFTREHFEALVAPLRRGETERLGFTTVHRRKNGSDYPVDVQLQLMRHENPPVFVAIIQDITERQRGARQIAFQASLLDQVQNAVIATDEDGLITYWNRYAESLYGWTSAEVLGKSIYAVTVPQISHEAAAQIMQQVQAQGSWDGEYDVKRKDGGLFPAHVTLSAIRDETGRARGYVGLSVDISERKRTEERLSYLAYYDPLTELPNRAQLLERLQQAMLDAGRVNRIVAVMFLDLDRFKYINDTLGHHVGDGLLRAVAERLKGCVRPGDIIARLGGDEFAVVLANVAHADDVARVARKLIDSFAKAFQVDGHDLYTSTSVGVTLYPFDEQNPKGLLKNADAAMYSAKERGRNNFQFFTAELNTRAGRRLRIETALRTAIERRELSLHYQPQVDAKTGGLVGMEALLRWQHPELGNVSPVEFIPVAEETGLILPIGEWVLREACRQTKAWHATNFSFSKMQVAVNISGKQLRQKDFPDLVRQALEDTGLDARYLDLELTESTLLEDIEEIADTMHVLHDQGVSFSVDDFGTGYSSLAYLKRFPIDVLKIDRSFVRDIPGDPNDVAIVKAIIAMAHTLDMRVIAEGVETHDQLQFLRSQDCDGSQGYYCSVPLSAGEFSELLADWADIRQGRCRVSG